MVNALDLGSSDLGSRTGLGHCVAFLRKTFCIPISFINYAAHCMAWLSYGKRLWPKQ